jgi:hypothetical protein
MQDQNDQEQAVEQKKPAGSGCGSIFFLIIVLAFIAYFIACVDSGGAKWG